MHIRLGITIHFVVGHNMYIPAVRHQMWANRRKTTTVTEVGAVVGPPVDILLGFLWKFSRSVSSPKRRLWSGGFTHYWTLLATPLPPPPQRLRQQHVSMTSIEWELILLVRNADFPMMFTQKRACATNAKTHLHTSSIQHKERKSPPITRFALNIK